MKQIIKTSIILITFLVVGNIGFSQNTQKEEVEKIRKSIEQSHQDIDWQAFDSSSSVSAENINSNLIQGLWKAYNGLFKFGGAVNSMILTQPFIIEIKGDKYRRSMDSKFFKITLTNNQIISKKENDFGVINKITDHLLVITWKSGDNLTRYYYEK